MCWNNHPWREGGVNALGVRLPGVFHLGSTSPFICSQLAVFPFFSGVAGSVICPNWWQPLDDGPEEDMGALICLPGGVLGNRLRHIVVASLHDTQSSHRWSPHPCVVSSFTAPGLVCVTNRICGSKAMSLPRLGHKTFCSFQVGVFLSLTLSLCLSLSLPLTVSVSVSVSISLSVCFSVFASLSPLPFCLGSLLWGSQLRCHEQPYAEVTW